MKSPLTAGGIQIAGIRKMKNEKRHLFTLLELIVAAAIFGIFMALMSGVLFVMTNSWNIQNESAEKL